MNNDHGENDHHVIYEDEGMGIFVTGPYAFISGTKRTISVRYQAAEPPTIRTWFLAERHFYEYIEDRKGGSLVYPSKLNELSYCEEVVLGSESSNAGDNLQQNLLTINTKDENGVYILIISPSGDLDDIKTNIMLMFANRQPVQFGKDSNGDLAEITDLHLKLWVRFGNAFMADAPRFYKSMLFIEIDEEIAQLYYNDPDGQLYDKDLAARFDDICQGKGIAGIEEITLEVGGYERESKDDREELPCFDLTYMREVSRREKLLPSTGSSV